MDNSFSTFVKILGKKEELESAINKLSLNLDNKSLKLVLDIFNLLTVNNNENAPINGLVEKFKEILSDGKIDVYDVPILVKLVTDILNLNMSNLKGKFGIKEAGIVVKVIILILTDLDIVKNSDLAMKLVDSSLSLLETTIDVKYKVFSCC
jgi:hypothetical protein